MSRIKEVWNRIPRTIKECIIFTELTFLVFAMYFVGKVLMCEVFFEIVDDDFSKVMQIESVVSADEDVILTGWAFELGVDSTENDFSVVLYDYNNDNKYKCEVQDITRNDVNEYFLCEFDYAKSGFVACIDKKKIDLQNNNFEILIKDNNGRKAYRTGVYLSKGEITYVKPEVYVALDVEGTAIEEIVNDGVLRVYRQDVGMYVYQYEGGLYWIAEKKYMFEEDGTTLIQCQINTTQPKNLPQFRLDNGWMWDNIGFDFESKELTDIDCGKYRVSKRELPTSYSVTKMWTGYHDGNWIWRQDFRPWYEF